MSADMQEYSRQLNLLGAVSCFQASFCFFTLGFPKQSKLGWMDGSSVPNNWPSR